MEKQRLQKQRRPRIGSKNKEDEGKTKRSHENVRLNDKKLITKTRIVHEPLRCDNEKLTLHY